MKFDPQLLTVKEVAERLQCSDANVYALVEAGQLPFVRIGRSKGYRIDAGDLAAFIEERKVQKTGAKPRPPRPRLKHIRF